MIWILLDSHSFWAWLCMYVCLCVCASECAYVTNLCNFGFLQLSSSNSILGSRVWICRHFITLFYYYEFSFVFSTSTDSILGWALQQFLLLANEFRCARNQKQQQSQLHQCSMNIFVELVDICFVTNFQSKILLLLKWE